jgi:3-oxoacyl-[acyl-carrier-protein] synthase II
MRRVAITGIGLATALGTTTEETWQGLLAGKSGIGPIQEFNTASFRTKLGGEVRALDPSQFISNRRTLRMMTRNDQLAVIGASLAMRDSGLELTEEQQAQTGLFVASNKEISNPNHLLEGTLVARNEDGSVDMHKLGAEAKSAFYPLFFVEGLQAASLFYVSQTFNLKGANTYFSGTADAGATAIGRAFRAVKRGESDIVIAGGFEDAVSWWNMTKFDAMGILTDRNDLGVHACRPFDRDRTGTVLGEGAAFTILEPYDTARRRGARIYAEIIGFGGGYDAYNIVQPHPEGRGLANAIEAALREAGSSPQDIGYVAAHGTGTRLGDASEAHALRHVFGGNGAPVASSVKPATGHMIGGAGALNIAVAALTLHNQKAPPTLNLDHPDPECALDWIPKEARDLKVNQAIALARGLEGQNVALVLRK